MYETDLLLFIFFVTLFIYLKSVFRDLFKYLELFKSIPGPKTLPVGLLAYIFTARNESGRPKSQASQVGLISEVIELLFQIAFKYSKTCQRNIQTFIASGLAPNTFSSPMIPASHRNFWPSRSVSRRTFLWNYLDFPMA